MILNKLTVRERKILNVVIVLVLVLMGYYGVWLPTMEKFSSLDDEIFSLQMKIRKAKIFLRQRDDILEQAKNFQNLEHMDAGSDEEEIARLLSLIEQTARKTGVSLSDVKPQQVQSDKWSKRFVVELNAESGLGELIDFIHAMQMSPQMLKLERVDVVPKGEQSRVMRSYMVLTRVVVK